MSGFMSIIKNVARVGQIEQHDKTIAALGNRVRELNSKFNAEKRIFDETVGALQEKINYLMKFTSKPGQVETHHASVTNNVIEFNSASKFLPARMWIELNEPGSKVSPRSLAYLAASYCRKNNIQIGQTRFHYKSQTGEVGAIVSCYPSHVLRDCYISATTPKRKVG